jgi:hypothetical protein
MRQNSCRWAELLHLAQVVIRGRDESLALGAFLAEEPVGCPAF